MAVTTGTGGAVGAGRGTAKHGRLAQGRTRRRRRRVMAALLVVEALVVAFFLLQVLYQPVQRDGLFVYGVLRELPAGSTADAGATERVPSAEGEVLVVDQPLAGVRVVAVTGLSVSGWLPVTVTDVQLVSGPLDGLDPGVPLLVESAAGGATGESLGSFRPVQLAPGATVDVAATARVTGCDQPGLTAESSGTLMSVTSMIVSYRMLGVPHEVQVPLVQPVGVRDWTRCA